MARELKSQLKELQQIFPKNHESFCILHTTADELSCRFITKDQTFYDFQATITVSDLNTILCTVKRLLS